MFPRLIILANHCRSLLLFRLIVTFLSSVLSNNWFFQDIPLLWSPSDRTGLSRLVLCLLIIVFTDSSSCSLPFFSTLISQRLIASAQIVTRHHRPSQAPANGIDPHSQFRQHLIDFFLFSKMFSSNSTQQATTASNNFETDFSRQIKFVLFLPFQLCSVPVGIFVLYQLITKSALRQSLPNHVLIALNIVTLVDVIFQQPGSMIFFRLNHVWPESPAFCIFLNYLDYLDYGLNLHLTVWALFERQVFIFDPSFCRNRRSRQLFHFVPLCAIIAYTVILYLGLIIFNPCENAFDYTQSWCGDLCFLQNHALYFFDWIVNGLLPIFLIVVLSAALLIRVVRQKHHVHQPFVWSKHRKLTMQLLSLSTLYIVCFLPSILNALIGKVIKEPEFGIKLETAYLDYLPVLARSLTPFLSLAALPVVSKMIKTSLARWCLCCHVAVAPRNWWDRAGCSKQSTKLCIDYEILFYSFRWIDTIQRNPPRGDAWEERKEKSSVVYACQFRFLWSDLIILISWFWSSFFQVIHWEWRRKHCFYMTNYIHEHEREKKGRGGEGMRARARSSSSSSIHYKVI